MIMRSAPTSISYLYEYPTAAPGTALAPVNKGRAIAAVSEVA